jgi:hypothetical protein
LHPTLIHVALTVAVLVPFNLLQAEELLPLRRWLPLPTAMVLSSGTTAHFHASTAHTTQPNADRKPKMDTSASAKKVDEQIQSFLVQKRLTTLAQIQVATADSRYRPRPHYTSREVQDLGVRFGADLLIAPLFTKTKTETKTLTFTLLAYSAQTGQLITKTDFDGVGDEVDPIFFERFLKQLIEKIPYDGIAIVDPTIGKPVFEHDGHQTAYVQLLNTPLVNTSPVTDAEQSIKLENTATNTSENGADRFARVGDAVQWVRLHIDHHQAKTPTTDKSTIDNILFNNIIKSTTMGEGIIVAIHHDRATAKVTQLFPGEQIEPSTLVRLTRRAISTSRPAAALATTNKVDAGGTLPQPIPPTPASSTIEKWTTPLGGMALLLLMFL